MRRTQPTIIASIDSILNPWKATRQVQAYEVYNHIVCLRSIHYKEEPISAWNAARWCGHIDLCIKTPKTTIFFPKPPDYPITHIYQGSNTNSTAIHHHECKWSYKYQYKWFRYQWNSYVKHTKHNSWVQANLKAANLWPLFTIKVVAKILPLSVCPTFTPNPLRKSQAQCTKFISSLGHYHTDTHGGTEAPHVCVNISNIQTSHADNNRARMEMNARHKTVCNWFRHQS